MKYLFKKIKYLFFLFFIISLHAAKTSDLVAPVVKGTSSIMSTVNKELSSCLSRDFMPSCMQNVNPVIIKAIFAYLCLGQLYVHCVRRIWHSVVLDEYDKTEKHHVPVSNSDKLEEKSDFIKIGNRVFFINNLLSQFWTSKAIEKIPFIENTLLKNITNDGSPFWLRSIGPINVAVGIICTWIAYKGTSSIVKVLNIF